MPSLESILTEPEQSAMAKLVRNLAADVRKVYRENGYNWPLISFGPGAGSDEDGMSVRLRHHVSNTVLYTLCYNGEEWDLICRFFAVNGNKHAVGLNNRLLLFCRDSGHTEPELIDRRILEIYGPPAEKWAQDAYAENPAWGAF